MNRVLEQLGYGPDDRVVILHADDIGMCQATLPAFDGLLNAGLVSSGAVMVPCPMVPISRGFLPPTSRGRCGHPSDAAL